MSFDGWQSQVWTPWYNTHFYIDIKRISYSSGQKISYNISLVSVISSHKNCSFHFKKTFSDDKDIVFITQKEHN